MVFRRKTGPVEPPTDMDDGGSTSLSRRAPKVGIGLPGQRRCALTTLEVQEVHVSTRRYSMRSPFDPPSIRIALAIVLAGLGCQLPETEEELLSNEDGLPGKDNSEEAVGSRSEALIVDQCLALGDQGRYRFNLTCFNPFSNNDCLWYVSTRNANIVSLTASPGRVSGAFIYVPDNRTATIDLVLTARAIGTADFSTSFCRPTSALNCSWDWPIVQVRAYASTFCCEPTGPDYCFEPDGIDNDCNGRIDDRRSQDTCRSPDGIDNDCDGQVDEPSAEICDGIDNDCDGRVDEDVDPRTCGTNVGACATGLQHCEQGRWGPCRGSIGPSTETCNGVDDDCDGSIDDDVTRACGSSSVGSCRLGTQQCSLGSWGSCQGAVGPTSELGRGCDGQDNDCDGQVDEGVPGTGTEFHCGACGRRCAVEEYCAESPSGDYCELDPEYFNCPPWDPRYPRCHPF